MNPCRKYGKEPYKLALIHGGPGAPGQVGPVAHELSSDRGILEPFQSELSVLGQVEELKTILERYGDFPMVLAGFSWGAWLAFIMAALYPTLINKLILISSGGFEEKYAQGIGLTRMSRLSKEDRMEAHTLMDALQNPLEKEKDEILCRLGRLFTQADAYDPITLETGESGVRFEVHQMVWNEAAEWRRSGKLLKMGVKILCPVVAIHGDYDPHPAAGVQIPLSSILKDFRFFLLKNCGHMPWIEREAREEFYTILRQEII